ncbi:hypothetical protein [Actinoplanes sp. NPDC026670]|uniref:hypothetical protein n=1 Tax=Actinoplanes sp. NPDC026670 TaxID=3154700 RepID=UPI0033C1E24E
MISRTTMKRSVRTTLVSAVVVLACLWTLRVLWMMSWLAENDVPPASRMPDLPAGASIVAEGRACGSGGCWWEVTVAPEAGQSPEDLARAMNLSEVQRKWPTLLDPGFVYVWAQPRAGQLVVLVSYRN